MRRLAQLVALLALAVSTAAGYYHYVRYPSRNGPYTPIYEKFDLNALVNKTVYFYVSEDRPALAPTDSFEALIGQVRQALAAWNNIPSSDLRVAYGGVANLATAQWQAPGGEIVFEELPPGLLAMAGRTTRPQTGNFVPTVRARVILPRDLSNANRTTASESFFNTLVHEIGHGLGLQHTLTGSAMTVEVTRSTTRARPIGPDDVAGLTVLYPANGGGSSATIRGRVTLPDGRPLHLISVVAINPGGAVISALTAPDGSYRIEGLPPASYFVYAHALPPAAQAGLGPGDVVLPTDDTGAAFEASGLVETQFYGGVKDPSFSFPVVVAAGATNEGIDFRLASRSSLSLYDVTTYSFPGGGAPAVLPAFLNASRTSATMLAFGPGLTAANMRNVSVEVIGGGATVQRSGNPTPYPADPRFAEIELAFNPFSGTGARHLVFSLNGEPYVRAGGVNLVSRGAPLVREVQVETQGPALVLVLGGDNLVADSRVYLDGVPAQVREFDEATGRLRITPPPGVAGRAAIITVYSSDGQSSVFVQPAAPATYTYPATDPPSITVVPNTGRAGRDLTVEILGTSTNFVDGQTVIGFGTPDIVTRRVWVLSPTRLLAVVSVSARAALVTTTVSVVSGSQLALLAAAFRVDAAASSPTTPALSFQGLVNSATGQPRLAPGSLASLFGTNLSLTAPASAAVPLPTLLAGTTVTMNDQPCPLLAVTPTQIDLQLPFNLPAGPVTLRVNNGAETSTPMVVQIDAVAPGLFRVVNSAGAVVDANNPARVGDAIVLYATGLGAVTPPATAGAPAGASTANSTVRVLVAGVELPPSYAGLAPGTAGLYQVNVALPLNLAVAATGSISIVVDGQSSNALAIALRAP